MAITTTTIGPAAITLPFTGARPSPSGTESIVPNAEIIFSANAVSVALSGVGDVQQMVFSCLLPPGWGYLQTDFGLTMFDSVAGDIADWEDEGQCRLQDNNLSPTWTYRMACRKPAVGAPVNTTLKAGTWTIEQPFLKKILIPGGGGNGQFLMSAMNLVTNQAATTVTAFTRFLRYDLNQAYNWPINTPYFK